MNYYVIAVAMKAEIDSPKAFYLPNDPVCFVKDKLNDGGFTEEANWVWDQHCHGGFVGTGFKYLYDQLMALNAKESMPDWGTRGT